MGTTREQSFGAGPGHRYGGYLRIGDHGLIGDLHTAALVGSDGTIDWYCCPRFDSPAVFGSLLDKERGGHFALRPTVDVSTRQLYFPDTNVLITRFLTPDGVGEVQDFMPVGGTKACGGDGNRLVRRVVCARGEIPFTARVAPRFDYGRQDHAVRHEAGCVVIEASSLALALQATVPLLDDGRDVRADFHLREGESATFILDRYTGELPARACEDGERLFDSTVEFWRGWLAKSTYTGRWREMVHRSALTLKLLTYQPTGALVAAPTTSLPELLSGDRNWDYRYVWIRDAAFSLYALLRLGFTEEAAAFNDWVCARFTDSRRESAEPLQLMYRVDGDTELPEEELPHLEGYRGSRPVRIGNNATRQLQLDIFGELIDSVYLYNKFGEPISMDLWNGVCSVVEWVSRNWNQPDEGVWETRGGRRHFTYSKLMCWVAIERAIRVARQRGLPADVGRWSAERDRIFRWIVERGWSEQRRAFVQYEGSDILDASLLLMPLVKFIAPTDPLWLSTLDAITVDLVSDSLVYRYDPLASPDGLRGHEGTFSLCTFWYVEALTRAGRLNEARLAFEKMLTYANHLGLYSEQIGRSGEQLGNFPQAFTHLSLISAACNLDRALNRA